jgi:hypothetical protein
MASSLASREERFASSMVAVCSPLEKGVGRGARHHEIARVPAPSSPVFGLKMGRYGIIWRVWGLRRMRVEGGGVLPGDFGEGL